MARVKGGPPGSTHGLSAYAGVARRRRRGTTRGIGSALEAGGSVVVPGLQRVARSGEVGSARVRPIGGGKSDGAQQGLGLGRWAALFAPALACLLSVVGIAGPLGAQTASLRVRNHHGVAYRGPIRVEADLPDGTYRGTGGAAEVRGGVVRVVAAVPESSEVVLVRTGSAGAGLFADGPLSVQPTRGRLDLRWAGSPWGALEFGLVVIPGEQGGPEDVPRAFEALPIAWRRNPEGTLRGQAERAGFRVELLVEPYAGGWLDVQARLTRIAEPAGPAYVALVRRMTGPGVTNGRIRFNGRVLDRLESPDIWERDFWYTRGVDWASWRAGGLSVVSVSSFAPVPPVRPNNGWAEGSHFYVWERTRQDGDQIYLLSEISGPNREQARSRYMPVSPYAPVLKGDRIDLRWRLALDPEPPAGWEDSQLLVFAGYRSARRDEGSLMLDLGVPAVEFGTSYFPYSTLAENFDFYRTPGIDRETWWPFSPRMWSQWRAFMPRMRTDLRIIRAMGFEWVRLHHLELLQTMEQSETLAFLDFFVGEARELGLRLLVDTKGPAEWIALIAKRYGDVIRRFEIENEILIGGIHPGDAERWTGLYQAVKAAAPDAEVFLTSAGNHGMFERLRTLGVPFDRVGLHAYKHGPEWKEAFFSHALGTGGYATDIGREATLGEFNWKSLTRLSPEARREEFITIYETTLGPRAIPEVLQFHFHETLCVNPSISRTGIRHYETIHLDRRPKPEAFELMRLIRRYARPDAPVRALPVEVGEVRLVAGGATAPFTVENRTDREVQVEVTVESFDGLHVSLASPARTRLAPGGVLRGTVELRLPPDALPGTYHFFVRVAYGNGVAYGWGIAANPGAPTFQPRVVLEGKVDYPQGVDAVNSLDWNRPLAVVFGPDAPVLEMEMAYVLANTLQSATGRPVRLSSTADLPDSLAAAANIFAVGTPGTNPFVRAAARPGAGDKGVVLIHDAGGGRKHVLFTGETPKAVQAAATDFVLRYWPNAKDAAARITGLEEGAALGNRIRVTETDLP